MTFLLFLGISLASFSEEGSGLNIGDKVPAFEATSDEGIPWKLEDHTGKKSIVVYFYPAAMTGGCTAQACAYRDFSSDLESEDAMVVGISGDNVEGLNVFKKAYNLNFTLLSDKKGAIAKLFGVPAGEGGTITREVDGRQVELFRGTTTNRWTFIIGKNGKIIYKDEQVDASKDSEKVLTFLKSNT